MQARLCDYICRIYNNNKGMVRIWVLDGLRIEVQSRTQAFLDVFLPVVSRWCSASRVALNAILHGYDIMKPKRRDVQQFSFFQDGIDGRHRAKSIFCGHTNITPIDGWVSIRGMRRICDDSQIFAGARWSYDVSRHNSQDMLNAVNGKRII